MSKSDNKFTAKKLAFSAIALALAYGLSWISLFKMPMGGSVTLLSMFFITIIGYWFGPVVGLTAGLAYGLLQMTQDLYVMSVPQFICDYLLAFAALGLSGLLWKSKLRLKFGPFVIDNLAIGYLIGVLGRYFFAFLSGWIFFGQYAPENFPNAVVYSLAYNGAYLGVEAAITLAIIIFIPPVKKAINLVTAQARGTGR